MHLLSFLFLCLFLSNSAALEKMGQNLVCPEESYCLSNALDMLGASFDINTINEDFTPLMNVVVNLTASPFQSRPSQYWPGSPFSIPAYVSLQDSTSFDRYATSMIISSSQEFRSFQSETKIWAELNGHRNYGAFGGFTKSSFLQNSRVKTAFVKINYHTLSIPTNERSKSMYSKSFIDDVDHLPSLNDPSKATEEQRQEYELFIDTYGTHVVTGVTVGLEYSVTATEVSCEGTFDSSVSLFLDENIAQFQANNTVNATYQGIEVGCLPRGGNTDFCCAGTAICATADYLNSVTQSNIAPLKIFSTRLGTIVGHVSSVKVASAVRYFIKERMESFPEVKELDDCEAIKTLVSDSWQNATIALIVVSGVFLAAWLFSLFAVRKGWLKLSPKTEAETENGNKKS